MIFFALVAIFLASRGSKAALPIFGVAATLKIIVGIINIMTGNLGERAVWHLLSSLCIIALSVLLISKAKKE